MAALLSNGADGICRRDCHAGPGRLAFIYRLCRMCGL